VSDACVVCMCMGCVSTLCVCVHFVLGVFCVCVCVECVVFMHVVRGVCVLYVCVVCGVGGVCSVWRVVFGVVYVVHGVSLCGVCVCV
jgi:hypothetical protein